MDLAAQNQSSQSTLFQQQWESGTVSGLMCMRKHVRSICSNTGYHNCDGIHNRGYLATG